MVPTLYFRAAQEGVRGGRAEQALHILRPGQLVVQHPRYGREQAAAACCHLQGVRLRQCTVGLQQQPALEFWSGPAPPPLKLRYKGCGSLPPIHMILAKELAPPRWRLDSALPILNSYRVAPCKCMRTGLHQLG